MDYRAARWWVGVLMYDGLMTPLTVGTSLPYIRCRSLPEPHNRQWFQIRLPVLFTLTLCLCATLSHQISRLVIIPHKIISKLETNDVNVGQPLVETDLSADGDWGHIYIQRALRILRLRLLFSVFLISLH